MNPAVKMPWSLIHPAQTIQVQWLRPYTTPLLIPVVLQLEWRKEVRSSVYTRTYARVCFHCTCSLHQSGTCIRARKHTSALGFISLKSALRLRSPAEGHWQIHTCQCVWQFVRLLVSLTSPSSHIVHYYRVPYQVDIPIVPSVDSEGPHWHYISLRLLKYTPVIRSLE